MCTYVHVGDSCQGRGSQRLTSSRKVLGGWPTCSTAEDARVGTGYRSVQSAGFFKRVLMLATTALPA